MSAIVTCVYTCVLLWMHGCAPGLCPWQQLLPLGCVRAYCLPIRAVCTAVLLLCTSTRHLAISFSTPPSVFHTDSPFRFVEFKESNLREVDYFASKLQSTVGCKNYCSPVDNAEADCFSLAFHSGCQIPPTTPNTPRRHLHTLGRACQHQTVLIKYIISRKALE